MIHKRCIVLNYLGERDMIYEIVREVVEMSGSR